MLLAWLLIDVGENVVSGFAANGGLAEDQSLGIGPPLGIRITHDFFDLFIGHLRETGEVVMGLRLVSHGGMEGEQPVGFVLGSGDLANGVGRASAVELLLVIGIAAEVYLLGLPGLKIGEVRS